MIQVILVSLTTIWFILLVLAMLNEFNFWKNAVGHWTWVVWTWVFPFFMIFGSVSWWIDPPWFGPIGGRVMAAWVTVVTIALLRSMWQRFRDHRLDKNVEVR